MAEPRARCVPERIASKFLDLCRRDLRPMAQSGSDHVARPDAVLDDLARYVHRAALSDKAITACDDPSATFTYRDSGDGRRKCPRTSFSPTVRAARAAAGTASRAVTAARAPDAQGAPRAVFPCGTTDRSSSLETASRLAH